jgi:hypothetical protein
MGCSSSKIVQDVELEHGHGLDDNWDLDEEHNCTACGHSFTRKEFCGESSIIV